MNARDILEGTLKDIEERVGFTFDEGRADLAALMETEAADLSTMSHEPGFDGAVIRSRDIIAMRAGLNASNVVAATKAESMGLIFSALRVAALFIA